MTEDVKVLEPTDIEVRAKPKAAGREADMHAQKRCHQKSGLRKRRRLPLRAGTSPTAPHIGELRIGDLVLPCAVLPDGTRVISQGGVTTAFGPVPGDWQHRQRAGVRPFFGPPGTRVFRFCQDGGLAAPTQTELPFVVAQIAPGGLCRSLALAGCFVARPTSFSSLHVICCASAGEPRRGRVRAAGQCGQQAGRCGEHRRCLTPYEHRGLHQPMSEDPGELWMLEAASANPQLGNYQGSLAEA
jgi:hypothetical protein